MEQLIEETDCSPEEIEGYLKDYLNSPGDLPERVFGLEEENEIMDENEKYLEEKFDTWVNVELESESSHEKASRAEPGTPAIVMD
jgi:hypothetical protein